MVEKERERKRNELGLRKCTGVAPELRLFPAKFFFFFSSAHTDTSAHFSFLFLLQLSPFKRASAESRYGLRGERELILRAREVSVVIGRG